MLLIQTTRFTAGTLFCVLLVSPVAKGLAQALFPGGNDDKNFAELQSLSAFEPGETLVLPLPDSPSKPVRSFAHLPLSFERNGGHADAGAKFLARGPGYQ